MNSKKRRCKRTSTARKRAESFFAEPDELVSPSDYIGGLDTIRPNDQLQLILRVSRPQQRTLPYQFRKLRQAAVERGAKVIDVDWRKGSGVDPEWLQEAAEQALREGAKLFATDVTRFIRPAEYTKHNQSARVSKSDLEALKELTLGVPLVTLLDPDKLSGEVRRFQSDLGKDSSDKRIGRPPYPDKDELLPVMLKLHAQGKSYRKISELTGVSKSRVGVWITEVSRTPLVRPFGTPTVSLHTPKIFQLFSEMTQFCFSSISPLQIGPDTPPSASPALRPRIVSI